MNSTVSYILSFLLYGNNDAISRIGYGKLFEPKAQADQKTITLVASANSPLNDKSKQWADFYPEVEQAIQTKSLSQVFANYDIVSIACFFLSRAEELVVKERDKHGRMMYENSLLGKHKAILTPLLDEYSRYLLKQLDLPLPEKRFSAIYLTHDVDTVTQYRHLRGMLGGLKRGELKQVVSALQNIENDPAFTFKWLINTDATIEQAKQIYFLKCHPRAEKLNCYDYPSYSLHHKDTKLMLRLLHQNNIMIASHTSYAAADNPHYALQEKQCFNATCTRAHYLRSTIETYRQLQQGDDFSMGYAEHIGFRMATTRATRWIDPQSLQLTQLVVHPLAIMDTTLSAKQYMNLSEDEAYYACQQVIDKILQNGGELTLLWHNSNINKHYHKSLYPQLLQYINEA